MTEQNNDNHDGGGRDPRWTGIPQWSDSRAQGGIPEPGLSVFEELTDPDSEWHVLVHHDRRQRVFPFGVLVERTDADFRRRFFTFTLAGAARRASRIIERAEGRRFWQRATAAVRRARRTQLEELRQMRRDWDERLGR